MTSPRFTAALLTALIWAAVPARADGGRSAASEPERIVSFLLREDAGARSFVAGAADDRALEAAALEWAAQADSGRVSNLAAFAVPGSTGERRLVSALSKWTGKGRISDEAKEAVKTFLEDAAVQAERLSGEPGVKKEADAAVAGLDQSAAVERARKLGQRRSGAGASVFGPDKRVQGFDASGAQAGLATGGRGRNSGVATASGFAAGDSGIAANGGVNQAKAIDSIPPAGNPLPLNFRNRKDFEVPSPVSSLSIGSSVNPVPGVPAVGAVANASGGVDPGKKGAAAEESGDAKPRAVFAATVARLEREGKRRPGKGGFNGLVNNVKASLAPGSTYVRCYDQAEELLGDLDKAISPKSGWTFRMTTYTGEGHEANGHYWVTGVSKNKDTPSLIMDPWLGEIRTDPSKNPIAIKPFFPWLMGAAMDKVVPQ